MKQETFERANTLQESIASRKRDLTSLRNGSLDVSWESGRLFKQSKVDYGLLERIKKDLILEFETEISVMQKEFAALSDPAARPAPSNLVNPQRK